MGVPSGMQAMLKMMGFDAAKIEGTANEFLQTFKRIEERLQSIETKLNALMEKSANGESNDAQGTQGGSAG